MSRICQKTDLAHDIVEFVLEAPEIAAKAQPGHFVVVMADEFGERVPLTIADHDAEDGTITVVLAVVGTSTRKLSQLCQGDPLYALLGPLGHPSKIYPFGTVVMVAGGVGVAPIYPIAKATRAAGARVVAIQGARSADLMFWKNKLARASHRHIIVTDDGTLGRKGLVIDPLRELLENTQEPITCVYAIGPAPMMRACAEVTRPLGIPTTVSLNTIMVDGTGMCGGCRVRVGDRTLFTCIDGPEFDGHMVDWDTLLARQRLYTNEERASLKHLCALDAEAAKV
jgi:ferredoxin--NADP+ reductase